MQVQERYAAERPAVKAESAEHESILEKLKSTVGFQYAGRGMFLKWCAHLSIMPSQTQTLLCLWSLAFCMMMYAMAVFSTGSQNTTDDNNVQ